MNIVMATNTYLPHVGGVARSVETFATAYRQRGHRVLVLAPQFPGAQESEPDVIRVPAIQNFNGSDFSVTIPFPAAYAAALEDFRPDLIHAHHPFLLGSTAVRLAAQYAAPLVFTHHTMYERYTHYVPGDSPALGKFVSDLSVGYGNLADAVVAPSESVAAMLRNRGVESRIEVIPTGIDVQRFRAGNGASVRAELNIPAEALVIGHVGRLAPEKNLGFLARAVARFLRRRREAHFLIVGGGPLELEISEVFRGRSFQGRVHLLGSRTGGDLANAYRAMDVFAFASHTETQGLVLVEAMAAGVPVVAIDAPGVREVVRDGVNGRLLSQESESRFVRALEEVSEEGAASRAQRETALARTAEKFSAERCADRALALYAELTAGPRRTRGDEPTAWDDARRRVEAEWNLLANNASAAAAATFELLHPSRIPGVRHVVHLWRRLRRWFSRGEWTVRLLGLPVSRGTSEEPGLILLQIDGLADAELERALRRRRMPFLAQLLATERYRRQQFYSGLPSTTPGVLGELYYGVRQAVPAFSFRDHRTGRVVEMFESEPAATIQSELAQQGEGLLAGGSTFCTIYSGGAAEAQFCPASMGWQAFEDAAFWRKAALLFLYIPGMLRMLGLTLLEFGVAFWDLVKGNFPRGEFVHELKFVPRRVVGGIILRELSVIGAETDARRGLPAIHVNFLGYDEQAHRRGPDSKFAHWTLRGIDRCLERIWNAAHASRRRNYRVWIFSDHGQERTVPYDVFAGRSIHEAVAEALAEDGPRPESKQPSTQRSRRQVAGQKVLAQAAWLHNRRGRSRDDVESGDPNEPQVVAVGPLGFIYWPTSLTEEARHEIAKRLAGLAQIPLVLTKVGDSVCAFRGNERLMLPDEGTKLFDADHPWGAEAAADLAALCSHPDAGEFVISGWRSREPPISFVLEHGAHGGPGPQETSPFVLTPPDAPPLEGSPIRPENLREAARESLHPRCRSVRSPSARSSSTALRLATYNVHSCIGLDGRLSVARVARVLALLSPDIVALQELDVGRRRSGFLDQAQEIARLLEMELHFHPSFAVAEERYGNAILSRLPLSLVRAGALPAGDPRSEPRGALWADVQAGDSVVHIVTTHLGLIAGERERQVDELLGPHWLQDARCDGHVILCGDFNASPGSRAYRRAAAQLRDVQGHLPRPQATWFGPLPLRRIDHVFVSPGVEIVATEVFRTKLAQIASDHLPLTVDFRIPTKETTAGDEERDWVHAKALSH